jgi:hypothetical protein
MKTTMKPGLFLFCSSLALMGLACSSTPNPLGSSTSGDTGGQGGSANPTTTSVGTTSSGGTGGAAGVDPGTWKLDSNITANGHSLSKDIRSAVSRLADLGQGPELVVELTSAENYCELLRNGGCIANGEVLVTLTFNGTTKGTYPIAKSIPAEPGSVEVFFTTIDQSCTGAGLGLDSGEVTVSAATLSPGGAVVLNAALSSAFNGQLSGTVTAPFCDGVVD